MNEKVDVMIRQGISRWMMSIIVLILLTLTTTEASALGGVQQDYEPRIKIQELQVGDTKTIYIITYRIHNFENYTVDVKIMQKWEFPDGETYTLTDIQSFPANWTFWREIFCLYPRGLYGRYSFHLRVTDLNGNLLDEKSISWIRSGTQVHRIRRCIDT